MSWILQSAVYTMISLWNHTEKMISVPCFFEHCHPCYKVLQVLLLLTRASHHSAPPSNYSVWRYLTSLSNQYCNPCCFLHTSLILLQLLYENRFCVFHAYLLCILLAAEKKHYHLVITSVRMISCLLLQRPTQKEVFWLVLHTKEN